MKIIFCCGGLEPGRDGVGDYTRRLAAELASTGKECFIVALSDSYTESVINEAQYDGDRSVGTLRIPALMPWNERLVLLSKLVKDRDPDWLSLQYVAFSFQAKGLPFLFANRFKKICGNRPLHIMFHEIWLGLSADSSNKMVLWGWVQQQIIRHMLQVLKPHVIHTHAGLYSEVLRRMSMKVGLLPLFSNLPVLNPDKINEKISKELSVQQQIDIVVFGRVYLGTMITEFVLDAARYSRETGISLNLVVIGNGHPEQQRLIGEWQLQGMPIELMGQLTETEVSNVLEKLNYGIFTTPLMMVEKSSAVATMWGHGIHLLCIAPVSTPRISGLSVINPYGFLQYDGKNLGEFLNTRPDFSYMPTLSNVAEQFISDL